jgi:hypothetical protein
MKTFHFIKNFIYIFLIGFSWVINAEQIVRFDLNIDYNTKFKAEMGQRLEHENTLTLVDQNLLLYSTNWKMTNGESLSPISVHYLIKAGVGRFLAGISYSNYRYIGFYNSYNDLTKNYLEKRIDLYEYKIQRYEVGYEFNIIEPLILTVAIGNQNLNRNLGWHGLTSVTNNFYSEYDEVSTTSKGLYQKFKLEYFFMPNISVSFLYGFGVLKGDASNKKTIITGGTLGLINSLNWKNDINYNEALLGINFKITDFSKIKVAIQQQQYFISYANSYLILSNFSNTIFNLTLPAIWSKYFDDVRSSVIVGYEHNLQF